MTERIAQIFATKTQSEWTQTFEGVDACVTPVLEFDSVHKYSHNRIRNSYFSDGTPKPSPVLSRTPANPTDNSGDEVITRKLLLQLNYSEQEINDLAKDNVIEVENIASKL